jgi:hypothetical protein
MKRKVLKINELNLLYSILVFLLSTTIFYSCSSEKKPKRSQSISLKELDERLENAKKRNKGIKSIKLKNNNKTSKQKQHVSNANDNTNIESTSFNYGVYNSSVPEIPKIEKVKYEKPVSMHGYSTCPSCEGTGNCGICGGTGKSITSEWDYELDRSVKTLTYCGLCKGTGHCLACYGLGKIRY